MGWGKRLGEGKGDLDVAKHYKKIMLLKGVRNCHKIIACIGKKGSKIFTKLKQGERGQRNKILKYKKRRGNMIQVHRTERGKDITCKTRAENLGGGNIWR